MALSTKHIAALYLLTICLGAQRSGGSTDNATPGPDENSKMTNIVLAVITGIFAVGIWMCFCIYYCTLCCKRTAAKHDNSGVTSNSEFRNEQNWLAAAGTDSRNLAGNEAPEGKTEADVFVNGWYSGYFEQNGQRFGLDRFELVFEHSIVTGSGCDYIGQYRINGKYNGITRRMTILKMYRSIDPSQSVLLPFFKVQLEWNAGEGGFQGKYRGKVKNNMTTGNWYIERCKDEFNLPGNTADVGNTKYV